MFRYIRTMALCAIVGCLLATIFTSPGGAAAGALKGFLVGTFIVWGEWKSAHTSTTKNGLQRSVLLSQPQTRPVSQR
jgi:hypothetical protein